MSKVAIVTDSNSGINQEEAKKLGIYVIPMPFFINDELFLEDITLTQDKFYEHLEGNVEIHTSQPTPGDVIDLWNKLLTEYDEIVHIPMSSALSSSMETATMLAEDFEGKVFVVDNRRIGPTQKASALDAKMLADAGKSGAEIKQILLEEQENQSIYIAMESLYYLKKGGRITPLAAAMGTMLNLKPVLKIEGGKLDAYSSKARGKKAAKKVMLDAMKKDMEVKFRGQDPKDFLWIVCYTHNPEEALEWKKECEAAFPGIEFGMEPLSLSVACHIGPGILAVGFSKKVKL